MKTEGLDDLYKLAGEISAGADRIGQKGAAVLRRSAHQVEVLGKKNAPVDTGYLRSSITTTITGDGRFKQMSAEIGPEASYGRFIEEGTHRQQAQPYMGPAAAAVEPQYLAALSKLDLLGGDS